MLYVNKTIIVGNLTKDPELKSLPNGTYVCNFSVATNRSWKDSNGQKQEEVEYHNMVSFGKQAESINKYFKKGNQIFIEGRIKTRSWEKDGIKKYATEIFVENFQFGNSPVIEKQVTKPEESESVGTNLGGSSEEIDTIEYPEDDQTTTYIDENGVEQSIPF